MDGSLSRVSLVEQVADRLVLLIREQSLRPGDPIPASRGLSTRLGVNMTTLREALRRLEGTGTVEMRHGSGTYVGPNLDRMVLANPTSPAPSGRVAVELLDARLAIEPQIAALAAQNRSEHHLQRLQDALESAMRPPGAAPDPGDVRPARNFHRELAAASGNHILYEVIDSLLTQHRQEQVAIRRVYADRERDLEQHRQILAAVAARKPAQASRLTTSHLREIRAVAAEHFERPSLEKGV